MSDWQQVYEDLLTEFQQDQPHTVTTLYEQEDNFEGLGSAVGGLYDYENLILQQQIQEEGAQEQNVGDQQSSTSPPSSQSSTY
tara:strand:+ start:620 stop:868 length:249 start_codon:yes stop_codon:yes gene_type:complete